MNDILEFLLHLFENGGKNNTGLGYSAINTARSALSAIIQLDWKPAGQNYFVCKFMTAVFNQRPALPRTNVTWDTSVVLDLLKKWAPVKSLDLKRLSQKLTMLLLLLAGQRGQTIHMFDVRNMHLTFSVVKFTVGDLLKTSRPGVHTGQVVFRAYAPDRRLCVVTVLKEYLRRTLDIRGKETKLLLTCTKPTRAASGDTIRRWTKDTMVAAGIDMGIFKPHSTRAAATSKARLAKLPLLTILKTTGWSNATTFSKYYHKQITNEGNLGQCILNAE